MVGEKKLSIFNPKFLEIINERIKTNPDIVNTVGEFGESYLDKASSWGFIDKVAYLLENKANIYLYDKDKTNILQGAIGTTKLVKKEGEKQQAQNCYKVFRILLNYEAEQRAYFPERYETQVLLKDQKDNFNMTPAKSAMDDPEVAKELEKAIAEAEEHYQKCLQAKSMGIILKPYHRKFLPIIEETQPETVVEATSSWTQKIVTEDNLKNRRIKAGDVETEPLLTPQPALSIKDRKDEPTNFVSRFISSLFNEGNNSKTKAS